VAVTATHFRAAGPQGVNLRALGKLTVKLGFRYAVDHPLLELIVKESKQKQIYDPHLNSCNESRLKSVVESLRLDENEVRFDIRNGLQGRVNAQSSNFVDLPRYVIAARFS
jgi:hypothetical protein